MLTEDMAVLSGEITALRKSRGELLDELARGSKDRRQSVSSLCEQFASTRAGMARRTKRDRLSFLHHLKRAVHIAQRDLRSDLAGARRAWSGKAA